MRNLRTYAHDVMAAMLVFQNIDTAAMLVYQTKPVRFELFCYVNTCFCFNTFAWLLDTKVHTLYRTLFHGRHLIVIKVRVKCRTPAQDV